MKRLNNESVYLFLQLFLSIIVIYASSSSSSSSSNINSGASSLLLRIRDSHGSMHRFSVPMSQIDRITLNDVLADLDPDAQFNCLSQDLSNNIQQHQQQQQQQPLDRYQTVMQLQLKHGSLLQLQSSSAETTKDQDDGRTNSRSHSSSSGSSSSSSRSGSSSSSSSSIAETIPFDPYPRLSKRKKRWSSSSSSSSSSSPRSFNSLSRLDTLQSHTMHVLSTVKLSQMQKISAVHVCPNAAQRFLVSCTKSRPSITTITTTTPPFALLFGTTTTTTTTTQHKSTNRNSKNALSVQIHAIWIPNSSVQQNILTQLWNPTRFDTPNNKCKTEYHRILHLASQLGLSVVGWIYAYDSSTCIPPPFQGSLIQYAAWGQAYQMKHGSHDVFITLAMDCHTGTTEAFQVHDILVQMFAESFFIDPTTQQQQQQQGHVLHTHKPIIVDGQETQELDCILAAIHTPMFRTVGRWTPPTPSSSSSSSLTNSGKCLNLEDKDSIWLESLCDFSKLVELEKRLSNVDFQSLCHAVKEYSMTGRTMTTGVRFLSTALKLILIELEQNKI